MVGYIEASRAERHVLLPQLFLGASSWWDMPGALQQEGVHEASETCWSNLSRSSPCGGVVALLRAPYLYLWRKLLLGACNQDLLYSLNLNTLKVQQETDYMKVFKIPF